MRNRAEARNNLIKSEYGIGKFSGPFATVYTCPCCKHHIVVKRGGPGCGRGYGLRTGGGAFSKMRAHVRAEHPDQEK